MYTHKNAFLYLDDPGRGGEQKAVAMMGMLCIFRIDMSKEIDAILYSLC